MLPREKSVCGVCAENSVFGLCEGDGMQHVSPLYISMAADVAVRFCLERILLE